MLSGSSKSERESLEMPSVLHIVDVSGSIRRDMPINTHDKFRLGSRDIILISLTRLLLCKDGEGESGVRESSDDEAPPNVDKGDSGSEKRRMVVSCPGDVISRVATGGVDIKPSTIMAGISTIYQTMIGLQ